jgi:hypothetical protein
VKHTWVKHTIALVEVLDDNGRPIVLVDPDQQALAEEDAVYGCQVCNEPLAGNFNTECKGADEDE